MGAASGTSAVARRGRAGASRLHGAVVVVDDEEPIRTLFLEWFRPEGVSIRAAASGQEAIAMVKQSIPDLMIVDVGLPGRDGIEVLEEALTIDSRIIAVVMTGAPTVEMAVRAMKAGATDVLMKPLQRDAVVTTARRLLELHRRRAEDTVVKHAVIRSGAIRLSSPELQAFDDDGSSLEEEGPTEFERGLEEGERRANERCRREYAVLADILRQFNEAHASLQARFEDEVVALAFHIAAKVLRDKAETCRDQIVGQVKAALAAVQDPGTVVVQVHPDDASALEAAQADLLAQRDLALALKVEPAPLLPRGSCLLHTPSRMIDASLDTQLFRLGSALKNRGGHES